MNECVVWAYTKYDGSWTRDWTEPKYSSAWMGPEILCGSGGDDDFIEVLELHI